MKRIDRYIARLVVLPGSRTGQRASSPHLVDPAEVGERSGRSADDAYMGGVDESKDQGGRRVADLSDGETVPGAKHRIVAGWVYAAADRPRHRPGVVARHFFRGQRLPLHRLGDSADPIDRVGQRGVVDVAGREYRGAGGIDSIALPLIRRVRSGNCELGSRGLAGAVVGELSR